MEKADLHVHTTASDGILEPENVIDWAVKKKINAIAITDHDTTSGIDRAIKRGERYNNIIVIPGIELSCDLSGEEVHILGYFIDHKSKVLEDLSNRIKEDRVHRGEKIVKKLNKLGLDVNINEVKVFSKEGFIGRPHIARVLLMKGYVASIKEAFDKYIEKDKPAYVSRYKLTIKESINLIHKIGGIAVLAHPGLIKNKNIALLIRDNNFDGIEVYHSKHSDVDISEYTQIADNMSLIKTGGSDCHGGLIDGKPILGDYYVDFREFKKILNIKSKIHKGG